MISKDEVKKLSTLSRIEVSEDELVSVAGEIDAILAYVGQIKSASSSLLDAKSNYPKINVLREDVVENETGKNTETLLASSPDREGDYIKVKKIL